MQRLQAFRFALMPDGQQERQMRRFAGSCRFVFNRALALQKERHKQGGKQLGYAGLCKRLTEWRNGPETPWLADAPTHPLQQTLKDLEYACADFFAKRADFPCFKKKGQSDSFRYPDPEQIRLDQGNRRIFLPEPGWLRYRNSREVPGLVKNVTVNQSCGKWFVSIQAELSANSRQTQARFACAACGFAENADLVGAINILRAGHARCACEVSGAEMPPAAGTHRSDSEAAQCCFPSAVGTPRLQAGEDVK